jgi:hypothetical protein
LATWGQSPPPPREGSYLPRGRGEEGGIGADLVELGNEPVLEVDGLGVGAAVQPAGGPGVEGRAGLLQRLADRQAGAQLAVEALDQQPGGLDVDGVAKGDDAAHAALQQGGGHRAKDRLFGQVGAVAGLQQDQGHVEAGQQVAQPPAGYQVGEGGRLAEIDRHLAGRQGGQRVEHGRGADPGVDEAGVDRAADNEQHAQRQAQVETGRRPGAPQLAADGYALEGQRAAPVAHHLPGLGQQVGVGGAQGQQAAVAAPDGVHQVAIDLAALAGAKEGVEQGLAPAF